jgi:hypothetical protein
MLLVVVLAHIYMFLRGKKVQSEMLKHDEARYATSAGDIGGQWDALSQLNSDHPTILNNNYDKMALAQGTMMPFHCKFLLAIVITKNIQASMLMVLMPLKIMNSRWERPKLRCQQPQAG